MTSTQGIFTATGYGGIGVTVVGIDYGVTVMSAEGQSRHDKALYTRASVEDDFTVSIVFGRYGDYNRLMQWLRNYGTLKTNPNNTSVGGMRVIVPVRGFDKTGIPIGGITFGDKVGNLTYPSAIQFSAGVDTSLKISQFDLAEAAANEPNAPLFYPGGKQLTNNAAPPDSVIFSYDQSYKDNPDPAAAYNDIYQKLGGT